MTDSPTLPSDLRTLFFCVGAQKAATTWLAEMLGRTPGCHVARGKEMHYWTMRAEARDRDAELAMRRRNMRRGLRDLSSAVLRGRRIRPAAEVVVRRARGLALARDPSVERYMSRLLRGRPRGVAVAGEMTPNYATLDREWLAAMRDLHDDVRIFFVLRDPVDRLWSGIRHTRTAKADHGAEDDARLLAAFDAAIADPSDEHRRRSEYGDTIEALDATFGRDRVAYFFFDTIRTRPELDRLGDFLGVGPIPFQPERRVNPGIRAGLRPDAEAMNRARQALDHVYRFVGDRFGPAAIADWRPAPVAAEVVT
ncbi:MAG: sulfotransferase [Pseudomonadota bacterium]